jgi:hypothetical protein
MTVFKLKKKESAKKGIKELEGEAFAYGERLFAEKPRRFVERIERYWDAAKL